MPDIDSFVPTNSKFLTKDDVGENGKNLTIARFDYAEVKSDGGNETKAVIHWREDEKPMVLNKENATRLKMICKTSDTDQMIGKVVNVYNDPFVQFAGRQTGGIRIRPIQHAQYQQQRRQPENPDWQPTPPPEAYSDDEPAY